MRRLVVFPLLIAVCCVAIVGCEIDTTYFLLWDLEYLLHSMSFYGEADSSPDMVGLTLYDLFPAFGLLTRSLIDDEAPYHTEALAAWNANYAEVNSQLETAGRAFPVEYKRVFAALLTMGDMGEDGIGIMLVFEGLFLFTLDYDEFDESVSDYFGVMADIDGDGYINDVEWHYFGLEASEPSVMDAIMDDEIMPFGSYPEESDPYHHLNFDLGAVFEDLITAGFGGAIETFDVNCMTSMMCEIPCEDTIPDYVEARLIEYVLQNPGLSLAEGIQANEVCLRWMVARSEALARVAGEVSDEQTMRLVLNAGTVYRLLGDLPSLLMAGFLQNAPSDEGDELDPMTADPLGLFAPQGDLDGDTFSNRLEWEEATGATFEDRVVDYLESATNPNVFPGGNYVTMHRSVELRTDTGFTTTDALMYPYAIDQKYEVGTVVHLYAIPNSEDSPDFVYSFSEWEGDYSANTPVLEVTMNTDIMLTAVFRLRADGPVEFPDPVLDSLIHTRLGKLPGTPLTCGDVQNLGATLDASGSAANGKIRDLTGLEACRTLTSIDLSNNEISDLAPLRLLPLEYLDLSKNQIVDVKPLMKVPAWPAGAVIDLRDNLLSREAVYSDIPAMQETLYEANTPTIIARTPDFPPKEKVTRTYPPLMVYGNDFYTKEQFDDEDNEAVSDVEERIANYDTFVVSRECAVDPAGLNLDRIRALSADVPGGEPKTKLLGWIPYGFTCLPWAVGTNAQIYPELGGPDCNLYDPYGQVLLYALGLLDENIPPLMVSPYANSNWANQEMKDVVENLFWDPTEEDKNYDGVFFDCFFEGLPGAWRFTDGNGDSVCDQFAAISVSGGVEEDAVINIGGANTWTLNVRPWSGSSLAVSADEIRLTPFVPTATFNVLIASGASWSLDIDRPDTLYVTPTSGKGPARVSVTQRVGGELTSHIHVIASGQSVDVRVNQEWESEGPHLSVDELIVDSSAPPAQFSLSRHPYSNPGTDGPGAFSSFSLSANTDALTVSPAAVTFDDTEYDARVNGVVDLLQRLRSIDDDIVLAANGANPWDSGCPFYDHMNGILHENALGNSWDTGVLPSLWEQQWRSYSAIEEATTVPSGGHTMYVDIDLCFNYVPDHVLMSDDGWTLNAPNWTIACARLYHEAGDNATAEYPIGQYDLVRNEEGGEDFGDFGGLALNEGSTYQVSFEVGDFGDCWNYEQAPMSGSFQVGLGGVWSDPIDMAGEHTVFLQCENTGSLLSFLPSADFQGGISNLDCRQPEMRNHIENGGFEADYAWELSDGWEITSGKLVHTVNHNGAAHQFRSSQRHPIDAEYGGGLGRPQYEVRLSISGRTAGSIRVRLGTGYSEQIESNGQHIFDVECLLNSDFGIEPTEDFDGAIDNVQCLSVLEVAQHTPQDLQRMRLGMGFCCLRDGAQLGFDRSDMEHGEMWWFDEFNANLGTPSGDFSTISSPHTYYEREFANGLVIVNPHKDPLAISKGALYSDVTPDDFGDVLPNTSVLCVPAWDARIFMGPNS